MRQMASLARRVIPTVCRDLRRGESFEVVSSLLAFFFSAVNSIVARCSPRKSSFLVQKSLTVSSSGDANLISGVRLQNPPTCLARTRISISELGRVQGVTEVELSHRDGRRTLLWRCRLIIVGRLRTMDDKRQIDDLVGAFEDQVFKTTREIYHLMERRDTIDILEWILDVLFFRNSHLFETISFLLASNRIIGAELLLRPQFEGTVTLEWCLVDPKERAQRFHRIAMEGALELVEDGFLHRPSEAVESLREVQAYCEKENVKGLPPFRQMVESLDAYRKGYAYNLYKYLSKNTHGVCVTWGDFLDCHDERAKVCPVRNPHPQRIRTTRAMSSFLQMRTIHLISAFDTNLRHERSATLEEMWELLYVSLHVEENGEPAQHSATGAGSPRGRPRLIPRVLHRWRQE